MFAGLKNKIKEETGGDVPQIAELVTAAAPKVTKGRHSRHGSTTSLGSFSIDGARDDFVGLPTPDIKLSDGRTLTAKEFKKLENKEDEWRKKLQKKDDEWKKKLDDKEKEWQKVVERKDAENSALLSEIRELQGSVKRLQDEVHLNSEYKSKVCQYQEDLDQLEGFQTQEMAKIKHLLLQKEQLLADKEKQTSQLSQNILELSAQVRRLQETERTLADAQDRMETMRHESETEKASLTSRLAAEEESSRHLKDRLAVLEERYKAGCVALGGELTIDDRVQGLLGERALYERLLSEAHEHLSEVKTTWSGKITSLETQVERLCRQVSEVSEERRAVERQRDDLVSRLQAAEEESLRLSSVNDALLEKTHLNAPNEDASESNVRGCANDSKEAITKLEKECSDLTQELNSERLKNVEMDTRFLTIQERCDSERAEKDDLMMRNAQVSQEVELVRQQLRAVQKEADEMHAKMGKLQAAVREQDEMLGKERIDKDILARKVQELETAEAAHASAVVEQRETAELRERNNELESQILDKNKALRNLQQRHSELKKAMTKDQKAVVASRSIDPGGANGAAGEGFIPPYGPALLTPLAQPPSPTLNADDISFKYLKHVLFKFLTCREYEATHMLKAVATLLRFTVEEERLLRETMDWKASWFGSRPRIPGPFS